MVEKKGGGWAGGGVVKRGKREVRAVCVCASLCFCPSCVIPQSSRTSALCKSAQITPPPFLPSNFFSRPSQIGRPRLKLVFHLCALCLSLSVSHTFSTTAEPVLEPPCPPFFFLPLTFCPAPPLLIRAICWRGRQRDLTIDGIVLYACCVFVHARV